MIKEAYVSYEIAKLLKEKGFDEYCDNYYDQSSDKPQQLTLDEMHYSYDEFIKAPTHQMACAWLRERNICITPEIHITQDPKDYFWSATIFYLDKPWDIIQFVYEESKSISEGYDDVIEQAIKYALENLI